MANEVVKYDNYLNSLRFDGFTDKDFALFMAICARMRDLGEEKQVFDYEYLMDLTGWERSHGVEIFHDDLKRMSEKLLKVCATVDINPNEFVSFVLFTTFRGDLKKRTLTVSVNKDFKFVLNALTANFTRFELKEYISIRGRYAKMLYQQLKQRQKLKGHFWQADVEELRHVLDVPERMTARDLMSDILKPAVNVIRTCKGFSELELETINERRRGNPVKAYKFTWLASDQIAGQMNIFDMDDTPKPKRGRKKKSTYTDYEQRDYDFDELEKKLVDN